MTWSKKDQFRTVVISGVLLVAGTLWPLSFPGAADSAETRLFDPPVSIRQIPAKSQEDTGGEVVCTYYRDLMIRESGTDTPEPDAATIVMGAHPACTAARPVSGVPLPTQGYSLLGKIRRFVVFSATDPNGAVPFMVMDTPSGRTIYQDGTAANRGFHAVSVEHGALHLRYTRGFNASCSIVKDPAGCWARLIAEGKIPQAMTHALPSVQRCAASYKALRATPDDPSVIIYDVEITIDAAGKTRLLSRGVVGCEPLP